MQVNHVSERSDEGTIDEVFERWLAKGNQNAKTYLELLEHVRISTTGPPIWAYEVHSQLVFTSEDTIDSAFVRLVAIDGVAISVVRQFIPKENPLPWYGDIHYQATNVVQATIIVVHSLRQMQGYGSSNAPLTAYVNEFPPLKVAFLYDRSIVCPYCKTEFRIDDEVAFVKDRHIVCGQRIQVE